MKVSHFMGVQFERYADGCFGAVINPFIKDGKFDANHIYEMGFEGPELSEQYVDSWFVARMNIMSKFIQVQNLFDILSYRVKELGNFNYLIEVFPTISLQFFEEKPHAMKELKVIFGMLLTILLGIITYVLI